ncbi:MAG TPA: class I SAM-dependent methyltransferase [Mycobacteriales bacterium]|nr:class I SAM-dependent methyltransferase [Mycobacteriales bacterium]
MTTTTAPDIAVAAPDPDELDAFMGRAVTDMGAAASAALVLLGDQLGLYAGLHAGGPQTSAALAKRTGTSERLVREWLANQAAGGYVEHDPATGTFSLNAVQAFALADPTSPVYLGGLTEVLAAIWRDLDDVADGFRSGKGLPWHAHSSCLFRGTERFFRPGYSANLVGEWLPALDGVVAKLEQGAKVADVGCGHAASTVLMAEAFPASTFYAFDYHPESIARAIEVAKGEGLSDRIHCQVASAQTIPGDGYDLICFFDCLHDMGDPLGAAKRAREVIAPDGTLLIVEPNAGDALTDNLNPVGRLFYAASTAICTSHGVSEGAEDALGAQAGEARLSQVLRDAGFTRVRRATETPFNMVLEARP